MVTDFRNECLLEESRAMLPWEIFWIFLSLKSPSGGFRVILKNLTNFRTTVETGMNPRLDFGYVPHKLNGETGKIRFTVMKVK